MSYKRSMMYVLATFLLLNLFFAYEPRSALGYTEKRFSEIPLHIADYHLFDIGVVDFNDDDILDIYTANHFAMPGIHLGDGSGGFGTNVVAQYYLSHDRNFPELEDLRTSPRMIKPGVYIYWRAPKELVIYARHTDQTGEISGTITLSSSVTVAKRAFSANVTESTLPSGLAQTTIDFRSNHSTQDGILVIVPAFVAIPVMFKFDTRLPLDQIYIGPRVLEPPSHDFVLALNDRHGMAWADFNGDGLLDVYITRGGLQGSMARFPETFNDELMCNRGSFFENCIKSSGIKKSNNRGRATKWADYNSDGLLDLYIGNESTPNQLFEQRTDGSFFDVAPKLELDVVGSGPFMWLDVDNDRDIDLLMAKSSNISLYRNEAGSFKERSVGRGGLGGQFTVSDYDLDGDLDVFWASPQGNLLLINNAETVDVVKPSSVGLPAKGIAAAFVDYDNDTLPDLHVVPGGLYRQRSDHRFSRELQLANAVPEDIEDARVEWFDANNDGSRDVLISFQQKTMLGRTLGNYLYMLSRAIGIERPMSMAVEYLQWTTRYYLNVGSTNHWLEMKLIGPPGNPQAIGASVSVITDRNTQFQQVGCAEGSYYSQGHYRIYFGLGKYSGVQKIQIVWPDGSPQEINDILADQLMVVRYRERES